MHRLLALILHVRLIAAHIGARRDGRAYAPAGVDERDLVGLLEIPDAGFYLLVYAGEVAQILPMLCPVEGGGNRAEGKLCGHGHLPQDKRRLRQPCIEAKRRGDDYKMEP